MDDEMDPRGLMPQDPDHFALPMDADCGQDQILGASIDSRKTKPGDVFFAISGERTHGVLYAEDALKRGAVCVIADQSASSTSDRSSAFSPAALMLRDPDAEEVERKIVRVSSATEALQQLGCWNRQQFPGLVIGITGSVGKTTTRQMIYAVLGSQFHGLQSPLNYNNELGVPLTLSQITSDHDFAVIEMGAGRKGDLAQLAEIVLPEVAVITQVAAAHLESFGNLDDIQSAKQELVEAIPEHGHVFLNADEDRVRAMAGATRARVVLFGTSLDADLRAVDVESRNGQCEFSVNGVRFRLQGGRHLLTCALAAISVGQMAGIGLQAMSKTLAEFQPDAGRGRILTSAPFIVVDDSYNASPSSVAASIVCLSEWKAARRRVFVMGDMLELGAESEAYHRAVGQRLAKSQIDHAFLFGRSSESVAAEARTSGMSQNRLSVFHDMDTLLRMLDCYLSSGDVVWIKGSRGMAMERVVHSLLQEMSSSQRSAA